MQSPVTVSPLESFLLQPDIEGSPAWEFVEGSATQKPMPTLFHSRIQRNLMNAINDQTNLYEALQEFRCIVPPLSPVPDLSVIAVERFSEENGPFMGSPDWVIEILSPEQSTLKLQSKILHLLTSGTRLAWLVDFQREEVWVWEGEALPRIYSGKDELPTIDIFKVLSVDNVMSMTQR